MTRMKLLIPFAALMLAPAAFAGQYSLNAWCFYVNSLDLNHSCAEAGGGGNIEAPFQSVSFNPSLGGNGILGTVQVTLTPSSNPYKVFAFWDYNSSSGGSNSSSSSSGGYNEYATAVGTLSGGESYSVDAPADPGAGGATASSPGNLTTYFNSGVLDDTNHLPSCSTPPCSDVAVALGQTVTVAPGTSDTVSFTASTTAPTTGFYISQTDGSGNTIYLSSNVVDPPLGAEFATPEPGSIALIAGGLGLLALVRRRRAA